MHFLYIIYSRSIGTYYVGETHDMDERLVKHNNHIYSKGFNKSANDWIVALKFEYFTLINTNLFRLEFGMQHFVH
ncbi:MAG TPA: GIY-YIG nuclease family protein [Flavobacteriaceae bacterium]